MKIERIMTPKKCDIAGCLNVAEYTIIYAEHNHKHQPYYCKECLNNLYSVLAQMFVPKSPRNKFNNSIKNEIKELFKEDK